MRCLLLLAIVSTALAQPRIEWTYVRDFPHYFEVIAVNGLEDPQSYHVAFSYRTSMTSQWYTWEMMTLSAGGDSLSSSTYVMHERLQQAEGDGAGGFWMAGLFGGRLHTDADGDTLCTINEYTWPWGECTAAMPTADGGCVFAGGRFGIDSVTDGYAEKLDADCQSVWSRTFNVPEEGYICAAAPGENGEWMSLLAMYGQEWNQLRAMRATSTGDSLWSLPLNVFPYSSGKVRRIPSGNYLIAGSVAMPGIAHQVTALRMTATGQMLWQHSYDAGQPAWFSDMAVTADGGAFLLTYLYSDSLWLLRIGADGESLWSERIFVLRSPSGPFVRATADGGCLIGSVHDSVWPEDGYKIAFSKFSPYDAAGTTRTLPEQFTFYPAYPNPFNPSTTLRFSVPTAGHVTLSVFDINGRVTQTLTDARMDAGEHTLTFDGATLPSGIYFARLTAGAFSQTQKLILLK